MQDREQIKTTYDNRDIWDRLTEKYMPDLVQGIVRSDIQYPPKLNMDTLLDFLTNTKTPMLDYSYYGIDCNIKAFNQSHEFLKQFAIDYPPLNNNIPKLPEISEEEWEQLGHRPDIKIDFPDNHAKIDIAIIPSEKNTSLMMKTLDAYKNGDCVVNIENKQAYKPEAIINSMILQRPLVNADNAVIASPEGLERLENEYHIAKYIYNNIVQFQQTNETSTKNCDIYTTSSGKQHGNGCTNTDRC